MSSSPADSSKTGIAIAALIVGGLGGYFLGQTSSLDVFSGKGGKSWPNDFDVKVHADSSDEDESGDEDDEDEEEEQGELNEFKGNNEECKLVLVVRTDLGMSKGKIAAQCSHATLAVYKYFLAHAPSSPILKRWERAGQAKVALQVKGEDELLVLQAQAISLGLCAQVIQDAGRTQIASGSRTVLGILGPRGVVDGVTGGLKLL
ncbi:MAG: hypothetical protein M1834_003296 [Cirrosporium novae-zelandiae]|nr:MAG: hypothetical protein M1834_003296 [Cirrosporium novae-zelandiae]